MNPVIETKRLILRAPEVEDLDRWTEMLSDPEAARFIGGLAPKPIVWRMIMQIRGCWEVTGIAMFSVIEKKRNLWIGRVGPWQPFGWPGPEVGWGLHPDAWGRGYALEAAIASMDFAFDSLGWIEAVHCIAPANAPSQALARRLGSSSRGPATMPPPFDHDPMDLWGQTRDAWRSVNRARALTALE